MTDLLKVSGVSVGKFRFQLVWESGKSLRRTTVWKVSPKLGSVVETVRVKINVSSSYPSARLDYFWVGWRKLAELDSSDDRLSFDPDALAAAMLETAVDILGD